MKPSKAPPYAARVRSRPKSFLFLAIALALVACEDDRDLDPSTSVLRASEQSCSGRCAAGYECVSWYITRRLYQCQLLCRFNSDCEPDYLCAEFNSVEGQSPPGRHCIAKSGEGLDNTSCIPQFLRRCGSVNELQTVLSTPDHACAIAYSNCENGCEEGPSQERFATARCR